VQQQNAVVDLEGCKIRSTLSLTPRPNKERTKERSEKSEER